MGHVRYVAIMVIIIVLVVWKTGASAARATLAKTRARHPNYGRRSGHKGGVSTKTSG